MIANADGKMMAGQFGSFIPAFLQNYHGTVEEGDVSPNLGTSSLSQRLYLYSSRIGFSHQRPIFSGWKYLAPE